MDYISNKHVLEYIIAPEKTRLLNIDTKLAKIEKMLETSKKETLNASFKAKDRSS